MIKILSLIIAIYVFKFVFIVEEATLRTLTGKSVCDMLIEWLEKILEVE